MMNTKTRSNKHQHLRWLCFLGLWTREVVGSLVLLELWTGEMRWTCFCV